jgi:hypothetical protein
MAAEVTAAEIKAAEIKAMSVRNAVAATGRIRDCGSFFGAGEALSIRAKTSMRRNAQNITNRWGSAADSATYLC